MRLRQLILREILHRKWNFLLGLLSVTVAVGCLVASLTLLKADTLQTTEILAAKQLKVANAVKEQEQQVRKAGKELENAYRKITLKGGFNVWILPEDQDLHEFNLHRHVSKTMPESYVKKLANSDVITVNHLLPMLIHRVKWKRDHSVERLIPAAIGAGPLSGLSAARKKEVIVVGVRGEVPLKERALKKEIQKTVPRGTLIAGHHVARRQLLKVGDVVHLLGGQFTVSTILPKGDRYNDETVLINLKQAQELLNKQNLISAIRALECNCSAADRIGQIKEDIAGVLPLTQVEEDDKIAYMRARARVQAKKTAQQQLKTARSDGEESIIRERESRIALTNQRETFVSILVPLVIVGAAVWIGLLTYLNVRQRHGEIGILRAIGLRSGEILTVFLSKALLIGVIGAGVGYGIGFGLGISFSGLEFRSELFDRGPLIFALIAAPSLSCLASWIPALMAARQDPAVVLQTE